MRRRKTPLALVHFDAHVDTWPESFGQVVRPRLPLLPRHQREGLIDPHRDRADRHPLPRPAQRPWDWTIEKGVTILSSEHVHDIGARRHRRTACPRRDRRLPRLPHLRHRRARSRPSPPAPAPPKSAGSPPGKCRPSSAASNRINFVGMDIVEVAPAYDVSRNYRAGSRDDRLGISSFNNERLRKLAGRRIAVPPMTLRAMS